MRSLRHPRNVPHLVAVILMVCGVGAAQKSPKPDPAALVAEHVKGLGSEKARSEAANRTIEGRSQYRDVRMSISQFDGTTTMTSGEDSFGLQFLFRTLQSNSYSQDHIIFDGAKVSVPLASASGRSPLGSFLYEYPETLKSGLFGGTLSASWALLGKNEKVKRLTWAGTEKIGDSEVYVLNCVPKDSSNLSIKLFFRKTDNAHVRTVYYVETSPPVTIHDEGRISAVRTKVIENFSNHMVVNDLFVPTSYTINFSFESPSRQFEYQWTLQFTRFEFTKPKKNPPQKPEA